MSYKVLQRRTERGWEDYMPVIGPRPEYARMDIEKKLGERTRWKPEPTTPEEPEKIS